MTKKQIEEQAAEFWQKENGDLLPIHVLAAFGAQMFTEGGEVAIEGLRKWNNGIISASAEKAMRAAVALEPETPFGCKCWTLTDGYWIRGSAQNYSGLAANDDAKFCEVCGKARVAS